MPAKGILQMVIIMKIPMVDLWTWQPQVILKADAFFLVLLSSQYRGIVALDYCLMNVPVAIGFMMED